MAAEQVQSVWFLCLVCVDAFAKYVYLYGSALLGLLEQKETAAREAHIPRGGSSAFHRGMLAMMEEDARRRKKLAGKLRWDMKQASCRFAEFDRDGNQQLDFEEFYAMLPSSVHASCTDSDVRWWFNSADTDGDGNISVNEFFLWSLHNAQEKWGSNALEAAFLKYDADGTGQLDALEFARAAEDVGFGAVANEIFEGLENKSTRTVSYRELIKALTEKVPNDIETKKMLSALVWTYDKQSNEDLASGVDTSKWVINGRDVETVQAELRALMHQSDAHVIELVKLFDQDAPSTMFMNIDDMEFQNTMRTRLGYNGSTQVLMDVFASLDTNRDGVIGFDELFEFVRGRRHSLDERTRAVLQPKNIETPEGVTLDQIVWNEEVLRFLIRHTLGMHHIGPADLLRVWAGRAAGAKTGLGIHLLSDSIHSYFFGQSDLDLWENEVKTVVKDAFKTMVRLLPVCTPSNAVSRRSL